MFQIGDLFSQESAVTKDDILGFAEVSHDYNPLHLNEDYAKETLFQEPIAHGILSVSRVSAVLGIEIARRYPSHYVVYKRQNCEFLAPVKEGDKLLVECAVSGWSPERRELCLVTTVHTQRGGRTKNVLVGEAVVLVLERKM